MALDVKTRVISVFKQSKQVLFSANPTLTNPKFFPDYDYTYRADNSNSNPGWGLEGVKIDDPLITTNDSFQAIRLTKPFEKGIYSADVDFSGIYNRGVTLAFAEIYIDNILAGSITSPPIDTNDWGTPYWRIFTIDEPSGIVKTINEVDYIIPI